MLEEDMDKVKKSQVVKYLKVKRLELLRVVRGWSEAALVEPVFKKDWSVSPLGLLGLVDANSYRTHPGRNNASLL